MNNENFEIAIEDNFIIVKVKNYSYENPGINNRTVSPKLKEALEKVEIDVEIKGAIIDLSNVSIMGGPLTGITISIARFFIETYKPALNVIIANPQPKVKLLLEITKMDKLIEVFNTLEEGKQYLNTAF